MTAIHLLLLQHDSWNKHVRVTLFPIKAIRFHLFHQHPNSSGFKSIFSKSKVHLTGKEAGEDISIPGVKQTSWKRDGGGGGGKMTLETSQIMRDGNARGQKIILLSFAYKSISSFFLNKAYR